MVTSKINGVTKHAYSNDNFIYYFAAQIVVVSGNEIQYLYFTDVVPLRFNFNELSEKYGTKTGEQYIDYLAENNFFTTTTTDAEILKDLNNTNTFLLKNIVSCLSNIVEQNRTIIYFLQSINE